MAHEAITTTSITVITTISPEEMLNLPDETRQIWTIKPERIIGPTLTTNRHHQNCSAPQTRSTRDLIIIVTLISTHRDIEGLKGKRDIITIRRMLFTKNESRAITIATHTIDITTDPIDRITNVRATITIAVTQEARAHTTRKRKECITIESAEVAVAVSLRLAVEAGAV